jgi:hypothetical protein
MLMHTESNPWGKKWATLGQNNLYAVGNIFLVIEELLTFIKYQKLWHWSYWALIELMKNKVYILKLANF